MPSESRQNASSSNARLAWTLGVSGTASEHRRLGGRFDGNGVYYIDSTRAGGNDTTKITLLDAPNQSSIAISKEGRITWSAVANNNNGYELIITYGDGTEQKTVRTQGAQYTDANYANVVSIQIRALGNGVTSVSSAWVTWTK